MGISAEDSGRRLLKSEHGTYIRANAQTVDLKKGSPCDSEHWYIVDLGCKVSIKTFNSPERFLQAVPSGEVDLVEMDPNQCPAVMWQPSKNSDGTWSFLSTYGTWLSGLGNGVVCCMPHWRSSEKFTLPWW
ncbi:hypothetical protein L5515_013554 [Caenorhabditis briggsae]|uniref:Uncharacterized protein n=1 Tax=Caenorhabditis briggsae TaxID=6238 RepID=A0AAE9E9E0_CAEBR|nr:hypothetical protein L5515_013554 [Caenorhabditis briggsae]